MLTAQQGSVGLVSQRVKREHHGLPPGGILNLDNSVSVALSLRKYALVFSFCQHPRFKVEETDLER